MRAAAILFAAIAASSAAWADDPPERVLGPQPPAIVFKTTIGWTLTAVARVDIEGQGVRILVIEGDVINDSEQDRPAPGIRIGVRDGEGREIYRWTVRPEAERIKAKDWSSFNARLESPPEDMRQVEIATVESGE